MKRGIRCVLDAPIEIFIRSFLEWPLDFFVPWVDDRNKYWPGNYREFPLSADNVHFLEEIEIWEIVIQGYPKGESPESLKVYKDYLKSTCEVCMIYYDCGYLDIYIKDEARRKSTWDTLVALGAEDLEWLTDENDGRTGLATH